MADNKVLASVAKMRSLKSLDLGFTDVDSGGLKSVARLKQLESLNLSGLQVDEKGLKSLGALKNLSYLNLSGAHVDDYALSAVAGIETLKRLDISWWGIEDVRGARNYAKKCPFSPKGIKALVYLKNLEVLDLSSTTIDDSALNALSAIPSLKVLVVGKSYKSLSKAARTEFCDACTGRLLRR